MKYKTKIIISIIFLSLAIVFMGTSYAYYVASVGGSGNITNNQTSVTAVDLGSIYYEGVTTFTGEDIYPGMVSVQTFKIGPQGDTGTGTYQIILENNLPEEFLGDVGIYLFKTTDPDNNYVEKVDGELVQDSNNFFDNDDVNIVGDPEILSVELLTTKNIMVLEEVNFDVTTFKETTYYLGYLYLNTGNQNHQQGLSFSGTIKVNLVGTPVEVENEKYQNCITRYGASSPQCQILADYNGNVKCPKADSYGHISVEEEMRDTSETYMCSAKDDYGDSYYYVGPVENNWVKFGGYYWRIIRVNGDDSIRLIYAGDASVIDALDETTKATVMSNGYDDSTTKYTQVGSSDFNITWKKNNVLIDEEYGDYSGLEYVKDDNAFLGYMYGNRDKIYLGGIGGTSSSCYFHYGEESVYLYKSYEFDEITQTFTLTEPLPIMSTNESDESYIGYYCYAEIGYRLPPVRITGISRDDSHYMEAYGDALTYGTSSKKQAQTNTNDSGMKGYLDNWYATNLASYGTYISDTLFCNDRSIRGTIPDEYSNLGYGMEKTVYGLSGIQSLKCSEQNDRFTVNEEVVGNGDLTYPIGLITADEVEIAGGSLYNSTYYLYTGNRYWTMTPDEYYFSAEMYLVDTNGRSSSYQSAFALGVRPVINLKPGVLNSGSGLWNDPYKIVE